MASELNENLAVCLVSGGLDSCVTAAVAKDSGKELAFLHLAYGQLTEQREKRAFGEIADALGVQRRMVVSLEHLKKIGGSALTDSSIDVPNADLESDEIPNTYVPFRNANMLAVAASWAEVIGAGSICVGAVAEDSSGYPDCRREFFDAFAAAISAGTRPGFNPTIETPIIEISKAEIVTLGVELDAPLHLTWSCYRREDFACGTCDSCALRLRGFSQAGASDPIEYAAYRKK